MQTCDKCGQENPDRAKFCLECGSPLAQATTPREERKVVTVLFADLVGFTTRSDRADPEDVKAMLIPFHARLKEEIERFGGTVDKFIGDAVLGVFGAARSHEDDPERAVRAALSIQKAIATLNERSPNLGLRVRVGINTGEAMVAHGTGPLIGEALAGDVVNTASRLQGVAPPGGVVAGAPTYRATRDVIAYQTLEPVRVKGKAEPLDVYLAVAAQERSVRPERAPLVGRDDELRTLQSVFERVVSSGRPEAVTISGDPGIGKSRLVRELGAHVPGETIWMRGRCVPYGEAVSFSALGEILRVRSGIHESDGPVEAARKLDATVRDVCGEGAEADWVRARVAPLVGADSTRDAAAREESFAAWRRFFEAEAKRAPVVVEIEDVHWADEPMLEFVDHLASGQATGPILVLCTARTDFLERRPEPLGTHLVLSPLPPHDTEHLMRLLLDRSDISPDVLEALIERAAGNALFAEEFAQMLADRGTTEASDVAVPSTVQALIAARLDALPPETKPAVQDAAVVGDRFWPGALVATGVREPVRHAEEAARRRLVRVAESSAFEGETEYRFWHGLIREVAYAQVPRTGRMQKHRAAAEWLGSTAVTGDVADMIAYHYVKAMELARASGDAGAESEIAPHATEALIHAGERALHLDIAGAHEYLRQALEIMPADHPRRSWLLGRVALTGRRTGRMTLDEVIAMQRQAIAFAESRGNIVESGDHKAQLAFVLGLKGDTAGEGRLVEEAIAILETQPPGRELMLAYEAMAEHEMFAGRTKESLDWAEKTLALRDVVSAPDLESYGLQVRGNARCELGDFGGLDDVREAMEMGFASGLTVEPCVASDMLGEWTWLLTGPAEALTYHERSLDHLQKRGSTSQAIWARMEMLPLLFDLGRFDDLVREGGQILEFESGQGGSQLGPVVRAFRSWVFVWRGDLAAARADVDGCLASAREIGDLQVVTPAIVAAAMIAAASGDLDEAGRCVEEFAEVTEGRAPPYRIMHVAEISRLAVLTNRFDVVERLVDLPDHGLARRDAAVRSAHAALSEARGDFAAALDDYRVAASAWEAYGSKPETTHAYAGLARCATATGHDEASARAREKARSIARTLGVQRVPYARDD